MGNQEKTLLTRKGKRGPAPTGQGTLIGVRLQPALLASIDAYIGNSGKSRPEAIREMIEAQLGLD